MTVTLRHWRPSRKFLSFPSYEQTTVDLSCSFCKRLKRLPEAIGWKSSNDWEILSSEITRVRIWSPINVDVGPDPSFSKDDVLLIFHYLPSYHIKMNRYPIKLPWKSYDIPYDIPIKPPCFKTQTTPPTGFNEQFRTLSVDATEAEAWHGYNPYRMRPPR